VWLSFPGMLVLCEYIRLPHILLIDAFFAYFSNVRISHIFSIKIGIFDGDFNSIWLPTEWHHPRVRTPVERDGIVSFKQFCTIFPYFLVVFDEFCTSMFNSTK